MSPIVYIFSVLRVALMLSSVPNQGLPIPAILEIGSCLSTPVLSAVTKLSEPVPVQRVLTLAVPSTSKVSVGSFIPIPTSPFSSTINCVLAPFPQSPTRNLSTPAVVLVTLNLAGGVQSPPIPIFPFVSLNTILHSGQKLVLK